MSSIKKSTQQTASADNEGNRVGGDGVYLDALRTNSEGKEERIEDGGGGDGEGTETGTDEESDDEYYDDEYDDDDDDEEWMIQGKAKRKSHSTVSTSRSKKLKQAHTTESKSKLNSKSKSLRHLTRRSESTSTEKLSSSTPSSKPPKYQKSQRRASEGDNTMKGRGQKQKMHNKQKMAQNRQDRAKEKQPRRKNKPKDDSDDACRSLTTSEMDNGTESQLDSADEESADKQSARYEFPSMLYNMLEDCHKDDSLVKIVSWMPHGRAFKVHNPTEFELKVMPKYFFEKYSSFRYLLEQWGFLRLSRGRDRGAYFNQYFCRGQYHVIANADKKFMWNDTPEYLSPRDEPNFYLKTPSVPSQRSELSSSHSKKKSKNDDKLKMAATSHTQQQPTKKSKVVVSAAPAAIASSKKLAAKRILPEATNNSSTSTGDDDKRRKRSLSPQEIKKNVNAIQTDTKVGAQKTNKSTVSNIVSSDVSRSADVKLAATATKFSGCTAETATTGSTKPVEHFPKPQLLVKPQPNPSIKSVSDTLSEMKKMAAKLRSAGATTKVTTPTAPIGASISTKVGVSATPLTNGGATQKTSKPPPGPPPAAASVAIPNNNQAWESNNDRSNSNVPAVSSSGTTAESNAVTTTTLLAKGGKLTKTACRGSIDVPDKVSTSKTARPIKPIAAVGGSIVTPSFVGAEGMSCKIDENTLAMAVTKPTDIGETATWKVEKTSSLEMSLGKPTKKRTFPDCEQNGHPFTLSQLQQPDDRRQTGQSNGRSKTKETSPTRTLLITKKLKSDTVSSHGTGQQNKGGQNDSRNPGAAVAGPDHKSPGKVNEDKVGSGLAPTSLTQTKSDVMSNATMHTPCLPTTTICGKSATVTGESSTSSNENIDVDSPDIRTSTTRQSAWHATARRDGAGSGGRESTKDNKGSSLRAAVRKSTNKDATPQVGIVVGIGDESRDTTALTANKSAVGGSALKVATKGTEDIAGAPAKEMDQKRNETSNSITAAAECDSEGVVFATVKCDDKRKSLDQHRTKPGSTTSNLEAGDGSTTSNTAKADSCRKTSSSHTATAHRNKDDNETIFCGPSLATATPEDQEKVERRPGLAESEKMGKATGIPASRSSDALQVKPTKTVGTNKPPVVAPMALDLDSTPTRSEIDVTKEWVTKGSTVPNGSENSRIAQLVSTTTGPDQGTVDVTELQISENYSAEAACARSESTTTQVISKKNHKVTHAPASKGSISTATNPNHPDADCSSPQIGNIAKVAPQEIEATPKGIDPTTKPSVSTFSGSSVGQTVAINNNSAKDVTRESSESRNEAVHLQEKDVIRVETMGGRRVQPDGSVTEADNWKEHRKSDGGRHTQAAAKTALEAAHTAALGQLRQEEDNLFLQHGDEAADEERAARERIRILIAAPLCRYYLPTIL